MDQDLQQKADLERSRNKQRQRLRASGRCADGRAVQSIETSRPQKDRRAWKKAQQDIDALLDPLGTSMKHRYVFSLGGGSINRSWLGRGCLVPGC